jgi:hypothetical protein
VTSETSEQLYAELVSGLLDARADPATERFDSELDAAVSRGEVTADAAYRLRLWQRASLRGVVDHTRSVLPAALIALETSRKEAEAALAAVDSSTTGAGPDAESPATPASIDLDPPKRRMLVAGLVSTAPPAARSQKR